MGCGTRFAILTNLFGPYDHFGETGAHVVPSLIARFVDAERAELSSVTVWGEPGTTRDFLYSHDAAQYFYDLWSAARVRRDFDCINVASGIETTMNDLAEIIAARSGFKGRILWDKSAPIGIPRRSIDTRKLKMTSTHPPMQLDQAIKKTIDWYSTNCIKN